MKIQILSDIHNEFSELIPAQTAADVVVLAGDIDVGTAGIEWAQRRFGTPVIYLAGNHEYYGHDLSLMKPRLRQCAHGSNVHFLDGDVLILDGVRFLGTTLWTDFELYGAEPDTIDRAMAAASAGMNDFRVIKFSGERFRPQHARNLFFAARGFLTEALAQRFDGPTVVITHHAPSGRSIHPTYLGDAMNPAFASHLDHLMGVPNLWIHGHMHSSFDYLINTTRVICNPRGYTPRGAIDEGEQENRAFDRGLAVQV